MQGLFASGGEPLLFSTSMCSSPFSGDESTCGSRVEAARVGDSSPAVVGFTVAVLEGSLIGEVMWKWWR